MNKLFNINFCMVFLMDLYSHDMKGNWNISTFKEFLIFAPKNTTGGLETVVSVL